MIRSFIRSTVLAAVQRAIHCECGSVLDVKRSVFLSQREGSGPCSVCCTSCFEALVAKGHPCSVWRRLDVWKGDGSVLHPERCTDSSCAQCPGGAQ